jgi:beta-glucosidase-like glycosyl hydrolase
VSLVVNSQEHQDLALEAALKAIVLLKNDNNVLPLASVRMSVRGLSGLTLRH